VQEHGSALDRLQRLICAGVALATPVAESRRVEPPSRRRMAPQPPDPQLFIAATAGDRDLRLAELRRLCERGLIADEVHREEQRRVLARMTGPPPALSANTEFPARAVRCPPRYQARASGKYARATGRETRAWGPLRVSKGDEKPDTDL